MPWTKANEGHRKEAKVPDILTQKTAVLSFNWFVRHDAVQPCKKSHMIWSGDEQEKSNMPECLEKLQNSKHSGKKWSIGWSIKKISSVQSSQLLLQVSAWKIYTGWTELATCGKWLLLLRLLWKLTSYFGDISLFSIGIHFKVFLIWSHAVRYFINYIVLISLISKQWHVNRLVEVVVSCKQIKFPADFHRQLKLITSRLKISLTKTLFVNTAGWVLKFSLC